MIPLQPGLAPFSNFETAGREVLSYLHQRYGFQLWMMTRTEGADWIVLQVEDQGYAISEGSVFQWADSFCSQMIQGLGPRIAPRSQDIPAYANAPVAKMVPIGSYIGVPVTRADGSLFGTLCAIDPQPHDEAIINELPLIELLARLLATQLHADLENIRLARLLERSERAAMTDALTGLLNRHGWDQALEIEEMRARRYGNPACVLFIDLDHFKEINDQFGHAHGDALLQRAAGAIRSAVRSSDLVARIGGDEFVVLGLECNAQGAEALYQNVLTSLHQHGIAASVGSAMREPQLGLQGAMIAADQAMYAIKALRHRIPVAQ